MSTESIKGPGNGEARTDELHGTNKGSEPFTAALQSGPNAAPS